MSVCTFIASDFPLTEVAPVQDYPLEINLDNGTIYDGGADDNYFLHFFKMFRIIPTRKMESIWNGIIQRVEQNKLLNI